MRYKMITQEMIDHALKRTTEHIKYVGDYLTSAITVYPQLITKLLQRKLLHDASKALYPEYDAYIYINWKYHCRQHDIPFNVSDDIKNMMDTATFHHIKNNKHHPEYWDNDIIHNPVNKQNRYEPSNMIINGKLMPNISIIEMVCDWCAVSKEVATNSPFDWADKNVNVKWSFNEPQIKLIYDTLNKIWKG